MADDRTRFGWPLLPCPKCRNDLKTDQASIKCIVPHYAKDQEMGFDPGGPERFVLMMVCNRSSCGEAVSVAGEIYYEQEYDQENSADWVPYFYPAFMRPSARPRV